MICGFSGFLIFPTGNKGKCLLNRSTYYLNWPISASVQNFWLQAADTSLKPNWLQVVVSGPAKGFGYTVSWAFLFQVYGIFWSKFGYKVFSFSWILGIRYMIQKFIIHLSVLERLSFECRKVIGFAITTLRDWLKRFAPLFHPIWSKTKTNCDAFTCIFPRFA